MNYSQSKTKRSSKETTMPAPIVGAAAAVAAKAVAKKIAKETAKKVVTKKVVEKAATKKLAESLKKSGLEKLTKINRTTNESDISYALRHGKITAKEAAAIDPKKFPLAEKGKTIFTVDLKTGKTQRGK